MNLDLELDPTTPVRVQPIIFLVADHRSRYHALFFDLRGVGQLLTPDPDDEGYSNLQFDLSPCVPSSVRFDRQGPRLKVGLTIPDKPPLQLSFPVTVCDAIRGRGCCCWHRRRTDHTFPRNLVKQKARPGRVLGIVLQETDTPNLTHTLFFNDQGREEWISWMMNYTEASPLYRPGAFRVDAYEMKFTTPGITLDFHLAASNTAGRDLFLRGSLTLDHAQDPELLN